jgi:hypothetical protein
MSVHKIKEYAADPAKLLNETSETLKSATKGTPVESGLLILKEKTGVDEGLLALAISAVLALISYLLLGVTNIITVVAFGWPAFKSVKMLQLDPEQAEEAIQATAMPLYWIVFSFILVLESFGVMGALHTRCLRCILMTCRAKAKYVLRQRSSLFTSF